ncbi:hypothetical protein DFQ05_0037 [Winogradskyella wandonensis]|uniref:UbiA prenyltransferase family protein n=1 Tax=Winogradskyella wandonensis TaxID=1442586 RepID=A0A4R1KVV1_9FLAO|nr:hypothetical protein [Winogradskyella wandonensis]TCK68529.1 hypothetical protein DFQ05_0037 [Winogradskyella wandonensis]
MKVLKSLFSFYVNSSIHVALAVYAMTWVTLVGLDLSYDENSLYFVFYATITAYNFVKYFGLAKFHHRSLANWLRIIQVFSAFCFLLMCFYLTRLKLDAVLLVGGLALVTFLYAIPLIPKRFLFDEEQNLRQVGGLKVYIIAMVWSFVTVLIPVLNNGYEINSDVILLLIQRFFIVIVLMLPFEIRDLKYDSLKLATIPQKIGIKKTKIIGTLLLLAYWILEFFKNELTNASVLSTFMLVGITFLLLLFSTERQTKYYASFWVEGIPIFWLISLLLLS